MDPVLSLRTVKTLAWTLSQPMSLSPGGSVIKVHLMTLERINHGILQRMQITIAMQSTARHEGPAGPRP